MPRPIKPTDTLQQLTEDADLRHDLEERLERLCWEAHLAGYPWRRIAKAAGMTAPGVRKAGLRWKDKHDG